MKKTIIIIIAAIAVAIAGVTAYFAPCFLSKNDNESMIFIYPDMTSEALTDSLKSRLGDDFGSRTAQMLSMINADISTRAGAYKIASGTSPFQAARILKNGAQTGIRFSFNNVRTLEQFAERVSKKFLMSKEDLLSLLTDKEFCKKHGKTPETIATLFQPDTYEFYWTVTPEKFIEKMHGYYTRFWNEERTAKAKKLALSPDEVATLASIVEDEIMKRDEAGKVARLYMNRLQKGMLLQADPTVKFALGDFSLRRIWGTMLKTDSPYNTYLYKGLPPGPIRFAEKRTIDAVLDAPAHPYLYMCAKEDFSGYHNFTASYSEHMANARRYQRALNQRGILRK